ncbi:MAG: PTS lactose/cellobiose transporter subunit IIA [Anaerococcus sp.]|nr:PTS lactose/cellobiose transporter subunit IIA [Anaerococcus sp.]
MDSEKLYEIAFQIIVHAGESRSLSSEAMDKAEIYDFESAKELIKKANEEFLTCHKIQTDLLTAEANGEKNDLNIIFVHAQDHLTMATMAMENTKRFISLYEKLKKMEDR